MSLEQFKCTYVCQALKRAKKRQLNKHRVIAQRENSGVRDVGLLFCTVYRSFLRFTFLKFLSTLTAPGERHDHEYALHVHVRVRGKKRYTLA